MTAGIVLRGVQAWGRCAAGLIEAVRAWWLATPPPVFLWDAPPD